jgi:hypothetical protein
MAFGSLRTQPASSNLFRSANEPSYLGVSLEKRRKWPPVGASSLQKEPEERL